MRFPSAVLYPDAISPSGVGYDIACGNKAVLVNLPGKELRANINALWTTWNTVSFGVGCRNNERVEHALFESHAGRRSLLRRSEMARQQLGTVGLKSLRVSSLTSKTAYGLAFTSVPADGATKSQPGSCRRLARKMAWTSSHA
jgi:hypothetical protein